MGLRQTAGILRRPPVSRKPAFVEMPRRDAERILRAQEEIERFGCGLQPTRRQLRRSRVHLPRPPIPHIGIAAAGVRVAEFHGVADPAPVAAEHVGMPYQMADGPTAEQHRLFRALALLRLQVPCPGAVVPRRCRCVASHQRRLRAYRSDASPGRPVCRPLLRCPQNSVRIGETRLTQCVRRGLGVRLDRGIGLGQVVRSILRQQCVLQPRVHERLVLFEGRAGNLGNDRLRCESSHCVLRRSGVVVLQQLLDSRSVGAPSPRRHGSEGASEVFARIVVLEVIAKGSNFV